MANTIKIKEFANMHVHSISLLSVSTAPLRNSIITAHVNKCTLYCTFITDVNKYEKTVERKKEKLKRSKFIFE